MKLFTTLLLTLFITALSFAQQSKMDSLRNALHTATHDSIRIRSISGLTSYYNGSNYDSVLFYADKGLAIARKTKHSLHEGYFLTVQAFALSQKGEYAATLKSLLQSFEILQNSASEKNAYGLGNRTPAKYRLERLDFAYQLYGQLMEETGNTEQAIFHYKESVRIASLTKNDFRIANVSMLIARQYAGIAHEIQNPLNFVNNFSEVSTELVDEMNEEIATGNNQLSNGNLDKAAANLQNATEIANDLKQNLEKINHHGKRAADIVKGMLQHSRSSSRVKEPTNINALADEYLRLAYHGLRAKDKDFNVNMKTDFDESIGNINIIPQDIGRVILNLINNAFYACTERMRSALNERSKAEGVRHKEENELNPKPYTLNPIPAYESTVSVSTKKEGNMVFISVKDNGNGIPPKILDKIFQPFFTTKPTGQGTGLGLSLSYDIVKAHGGELKVETKEGHGTEFIISLPI